VKLSGWITIACELLGDWARKDLAAGLVKTYGEHYPTWSFLQTIQAGHQAAATQ